MTAVITGKAESGERGYAFGAGIGLHAGNPYRFQISLTDMGHALGRGYEHHRDAPFDNVQHAEIQLL